MSWKARQFVVFQNGHADVGVGGKLMESIDGLWCAKVDQALLFNIWMMAVLRRFGPDYGSKKKGSFP